MVRTVRFHDYGAPEVLRIEQVEAREPGPGEVQIDVRAIGLNRAEALLRRGTYIERPILPSGLGLEAAGRVHAVGTGVKSVQAGDAVSIIPPISMVAFPTYGEQIIFPEASVVKHPPALDWQQAAAVWMPFLTAYGALIPVADMHPGDIVAITAASSSVGLAAIQIVNRVGAIPVAITRTNTKADALRRAGAAHVIVLQDEDLEERLRAISGDAGIRIVLDAVGGKIVEPLASVMSRGGILIEYGGLSADPTPFPLFAALEKCLTFRGYLVHEVTGVPERLEKAKTFLLSGLESGELRPVISKTFHFDDIVEAHRYLESNRQFGKIVVTV